MKAQNIPPTGHAHGFVSVYLSLVIPAALAGITATFILVNSTATPEVKALGFSAIVAAFLAICVGLHLLEAHGVGATLRPAASDDDSTDWDNGLQKLDEASEFFAASIKPGDMFRLISSRIRGLTPFQTSALLLLDPSRSRLYVAEAIGSNADSLRGRTIELDERLAGKCFTNNCVEVTANGTVAIPLLNGTEPYGVLELHFKQPGGPDDIAVYEAIGTRIAPLILSSIAFERSMSNALTDAITELPNERALYLVLESQIGESQRKREERPLTLVALDVKEFDEINQKLGHAAGDRVLNYVGQTLRDNLRQMDFLTRCDDDEFLAVLPTASQEMAQEVIARINNAFFGRKFEISEEHGIEVELNVGWAAFGDDGETADQLIGAARARKNGTKSEAPNKVLWFAKDRPADNAVDAGR